jgi:hypothetical protein
MPYSPRLRARVFGLEKALPRRCPVCAGRPRIKGVVFRYQGVLQTAQGQPLDEEDLLPCRACGGRSGNAIDGVDPGATPGIRVIEGVDPAVI